jgi:DNA-binding MarR family transcriptional regulator
MLFTNIANSKFNPCRWECFMERKQLVEKSRQSFTRLARFINQLMREQLFCGPVTVQQCYTLEALTDGPKSMSTLAAEVALHQSTLTRIVDKLEKQNLLTRRRKENNQRTVEVQITEAENRRVAVVESMEELANLLDPGNEAFRNLLKDCRCGFSHEESE